jgi:tetratricopeptide (TPR) repeat protein
MNSNRLILLHEFYDEDPSDPFNVYALALEYLNIDDDKARFYFDQLLTKHPNYLPTYYHAAAFFVATEQIDRAEFVYQTGMKLAQHQQNIKTLQELQRAYQMFLDELEM